MEESGQGSGKSNDSSKKRKLKKGSSIPTDSGSGQDNFSKIAINYNHSQMDKSERLGLDSI